MRYLEPEFLPTVLADDPNVPTALLRIGGRRPGGTADLPGPTLFDRHVVGRIELPNPIDPDDLEELLDSLAPTVMRAKGIAADRDGRSWSIQVVGRRRTITELAAVEHEQPTNLVTISLPDPGDDSP